MEQENVRLGLPEIRRVEDVVSLHAEVQTHSLAQPAQRKVPADGHVRHDVAGSDKCVSADRAECADRRIGERIDVEVLLRLWRGDGGWTGEAD